MSTRAPFRPMAAIALLVGACICLWLPAFPAWTWLVPVALLGAAVWWRGGRGWWAGPLLAGFAMAGVHGGLALERQLPAAMEGDVVEVSGTVLDLPQVETRRTRFRLRVDADAPDALRGKRLQLSWYDDWGATEVGPRRRLHAGERWRMQVKLRAPRGLRNPGGFDTEQYALANRIAATGYLRSPEAARRLSTGRGIDAWRGRMSGRIAATLQRPSARFVRALALGDTGGLDDADWNSLRATGLTHLIAISGFHVGIAAGFFALAARGLWWLWPALARRFPRPLAAGVAAACGGLVYAAVAGFALPTVRTLLMIVIVVAARLWRRHRTMPDTLALAAIAVLLVDPLAPLSAGFWLSFAGVAWLLWCLPDGVSHPVRGFLGAQGVATLGLLPLTVVLFGQASLAGPFANLVAVPWWSLVVVPLALLGTGLEWLHAGAGAWAWSLSAAAFDLSWPLFEALARSPFSLWWLAEARWFALPLALVGAFWLLLPRGVPGKPLAALLWLPLLWPSTARPGQGEAELVMLDVGQGLSVLVRTRQHALLYDMGPRIEDGFDAGERVVVPALHALGVRRLDVAMASHGDNDHAGGLDAVLAGMPTARVLGAPGDPIAATRDCVAGREWRWDGVRIRLLHPDRYFPYLKNESSCVLRIEAAHGAALLTGDIGEVIERKLAREHVADLRADVVTVAHHGSGGSSDPAFVAATGASLALVSAGHGNRFRHPNGEVVARWRDAGARVPVTAASGALRIRLASGGPRMDARRQAQPRAWDAVRRAAAAGTGPAQDGPARDAE